MSLVLALSAMILLALALTAWLTALDPLTRPRARSLNRLALIFWCAGLASVIGSWISAR